MLASRLQHWSLKNCRTAAHHVLFIRPAIKQAPVLPVTSSVNPDRMSSVEASKVSTTAQAQSDSALADKDAWSTAAEGYKSSFAQYPLHSARAGLEAAKVQPGEKLLDVACGPGDLAVCAARDKGATVDCIDFSEGMIDAVKEKLEKEPVAVTTHVMDGHNLTFEDSTFDIVTSSFGVMLFPDWQKGLKEMIRVTKPGGRILLVVPDSGKNDDPGWSAMELWLEVITEKFPEVGTLPIPHGVTALGRKDLIHQVLADAGLQDIEIGQVPFTFIIDDPESSAKASMNNPLLKEVQKKLTEERCEELVLAMQRALENSKLEDGMCGKKMSAVYAVAHKP